MLFYLEDDDSLALKNDRDGGIVANSLDARGTGGAVGHAVTAPTPNRSHWKRFSIVFHWRCHCLQRFGSVFLGGVDELTGWWRNHFGMLVTCLRYGAVQALRICSQLAMIPCFLKLQLTCPSHTKVLWLHWYHDPDSIPYPITTHTNNPTKQDPSFSSGDSVFHLTLVTHIQSIIKFHPTLSVCANQVPQ